MSPSQAAAEGAGPATGVIRLPHASLTDGGVGATASAGQFTLDAPLVGKTKSGMSIVYVYVQSWELPAQSVNVNV